MLGKIGIGFLGLLLATVAWSQQMKPLPDQLADCEAWIRVKQDLPCRCDHVERAAASLLVRAEKAERALAELQKQQPGPVSQQAPER